MYSLTVRVEFYDDSLCSIYKEYEMGKAYSTHGEIKMHVGFRLERDS
jgi:hypothetical protein